MTGAEVWRTRPESVRFLRSRPDLYGRSDFDESVVDSRGHLDLYRIRIPDGHSMC